MTDLSNFMVMGSESLLASRRFWPLFWTQFLGAFNDNFVKNALVVAISFQRAIVFGVPPSQMVALGGGIFILPFFLFSATAGQLADRYEKGMIIRWVKLLEIPIMLLAAVGFVMNRFEITLVALFLMGAQSTFFGPIKYSILPQHLRTEELVKGNAYVEAGTFLAILLGTIAGGALITLPGTGTWIVGFGLILVAVAGYVTCLSIPLAPPSNTELKVEWNVLKSTLNILSDLRKNAPVYASVKGISWFWFFGATMLSLLPPFCVDVIQSGPELITFFLALFSVGIAAGSISTERISKGSLELGLIPIGALGMTVFTLALGLSESPVIPGGEIADFLRLPAGRWVSFHLFMIAFFCGLFTVPLYTLMQERSDSRERSRTIAANNVLNALYMVVAAVLLAGLFTAGFRVQEIFVILALLNVGVSVYSYLKLPEYLYRFYAFVLTHLLYRFRAVGSENLPKKGGVLIVCNHVSFVDWLFISAAVRRPVRYVMDHAFERGPLMRFIVWSSKIITIAPARESLGTLKSAYQKINDALLEGDVVVIFPEGSITYDGKMSAFKNGVERILRKTPVVVVPMAIQGMWGSLFSRKDGPALRKRPRRFKAQVTLQIGAPLSPEGLSARILQEKVAELLGR